jgi:hypothetical protein
LFAGEFTFPGPVTVGRSPHCPRAVIARPPPDRRLHRARHGPRREGSASHARFALLKTGTTVADYVAAAGPRGRRMLRKAITASQVRVDGPAG